MKNALKAGVHSIEHGTYLDDEAINMMLENETYLVPTLLVNKNNMERAKRGEVREWEVEAALKVFDIQKENIKKAYRAGVTIAMGTDCGVLSHGRNLEELSLLRDIGMTPDDAEVGGTNCRAMLGWQDKVGNGRRGKICRHCDN